MRNDNLRNLRAAMIQADVSVEQVASAFGVNRATVYRKLSGKTEFVLSEVATLRNLLHLSDREFEAIFFNRKLAETQETKKEESV